IKKFVQDAFSETSELEPYTPSDWTSKPSVLSQIKDPQYREWAEELNNIWKNLTRKMDEDVRDHPDQHSLIYVPNPFVIPGGRFKEFYYWDTYWIVQGLLLCDMTETARGILENFLSMVNKYGHIPNGGRVYYINRSQPPMLIPMVYNYLTITKDIAFLKDNIDLLEKEFEFWMKNRTVTVKKNGNDYTMVRYYARSKGPRPESYSFPSEKEQTEFYIDVKSAAESGWDFSSRWFIYEATNGGNLSHINTRNIIPVDLNAFIYQNAVFLQNFNSLLGNSQKAKEYGAKAEEIKAAVTAVLWNDTLGTWLDYDILNNKQRDYFYPSNLAPLWTYCYNIVNQTEVSYYAQKSVEYISLESIRSYLGGIPTSLEMSNEQWDFPNAWPPLQIIAIQGLAKTSDPDAQSLAYELANNWVKANYKGYTNAKEMFEKYDAQHPGRYGGGGEYVVQSGFGWTNGVIFELLNTYGSIMPYSANFSHNTRREDYEIAENLKSEEERTEFYIDIKSAAESGWDFSSRWFISNGTNIGNLSNTHTRHIIPVDLNALIYWNADLLSNFNKILGNFNKARFYQLKAEEFKAAVTAVLWNEKRGTWLDYDILNNKPRDYFYPSNLTPLWTKCYDLKHRFEFFERSVEYINDESVLRYLGGIPTSLDLTLEQWDLTNAWPPLQIITIQGLAYTNDRNAKSLAYKLADRWVKANYKGYLKQEAMFEK
ncbi:hypothetical protein L9F63_007860, partial [Diploptera punctata]